jgi:TPR repeat protein
VAKDEAEAVRLYRLAADQGYAAAQFNLGVCYRNGIGVAKDEAEAVRLYRLAADQGDAAAQRNLGVLAAATPGASAVRALNPCGIAIVSLRDPAGFRCPRKCRCSLSLWTPTSVNTSRTCADTTPSFVRRRRSTAR